MKVLSLPMGVSKHRERSQNKIRGSAKDQGGSKHRPQNKPDVSSMWFLFRERLTGSPAKKRVSRNHPHIAHPVKRRFSHIYIYGISLLQAPVPGTLCESLQVGLGHSTPTLPRVMAEGTARPWFWAPRRLFVKACE